MLSSLSVCRWMKLHSGHCFRTNRVHSNIIQLDVAYVSLSYIFNRIWSIGFTLEVKQEWSGGPIPVAELNISKRFCRSNMTKSFWLNIRQHMFIATKSVCQDGPRLQIHNTCRLGMVHKRLKAQAATQEPVLGSNMTKSSKPNGSTKHASLAVPTKLYSQRCQHFVSCRRRTVPFFIRKATPTMEDTMLSVRQFIDRGRWGWSSEAVWDVKMESSLKIGLFPSRAFGV